jgi:two-component system, OmpR family, sensor histidine kinase CreC
MRNLKLSVRIALSFAFVTILSTGIVAVAAYREMRPMLLEAVEITLIDTSRILASGLAESYEAKQDLSVAVSEFRSSLKRMLATKFPVRNSADQDSHHQLRIFVTDDRGSLLFDNQDLEAIGQDFSRWRDIALTLKGQYGARATRQNPDDPATSIHFISAPVLSSGKLVAVVSIGKPVDSVATQIRKNKFRIALIFGLTLLFSIPLAYIASKLIARPIERLKDYVERQAKGDPVNLPRLAEDEIGALAKSFEDLRLKLEGKKYIETYVHNLTHEMKSPLTGILGASELLVRASETNFDSHASSSSPRPATSLSQDAQVRLLGNIQSEAKRLHMLAEKLLELASLEARVNETLKRESFNLSLLIDEVMDSFHAQARTLGIRLDNRCNDEISLTAERFLIWQSVANLVQNALEFSSAEGGTISIDVEQLAVGTLKVIVQDDGAGFQDYALSRASERFFSTERPRTGKKSSGLGLSFVRQVMNMHGGELLLKNREPRGARIELVFHT